MNRAHARNDAKHRDTRPILGIVLSVGGDSTPR